MAGAGDSSTRSENRPDPKRAAILDAAYVQFMRYGYQRTSMEDIARETGVSRASLYTHFSNKEEIFRSLSEQLHESALALSEAALKGQDSLPVRAAAALLGRTRRFVEIVHESPHGAELVDENSRQCGDIAAATDARFQKQLVDALRQAAREGEIDLAAAGLNAVSAGDLLRLSTYGLKSGVSDADEFEGRLAKLVRIFFAGLSPR